MILTKEQVEMLNICDNPYNCAGEECECFIKTECILTFDNVVETLKHAWEEADKKELAHEKARRAVQVELNDCYKRCNTLENAIETITDTYQLEASDYDWLIEILGGA